MKLYFLLVHPTHYFEFFLKNLQKTVGKETDIQVYFLKGVDKKYPWKSNFRDGYKSTVLNDNFLNYKLLKEIFLQRNSTFILVGWERIDKLTLILLMSLWRKKYLIYTDTPDTYTKRSWLKSSIRNLVIKLISKTSFGLIVTGEIGIQKAETWNIPFKHIFNLPFFVDKDFFKPNTIKNSPDNGLVFFSSGRLVNSHKGYDLIISVFGNLKKKGLINNFKYIIAGEGPDKQKINELIKENNLEAEIQLLGWIEPTKLVLLYQSCHIFLHPSRFDPYPNAVLEAMACGLAIIASDRAGSAVDRIKDGTNGIIFESGNTQSLENACLKLITNTALIEELGKEAWKTSTEWPVSVGENVIKEILIPSPRQ